MTVSELIRALDLAVFHLEDGDREIEGGYAGDLLSWVMGRAQPGDAWVTIMSNGNVVAVASLADTACVILSEGVQPDQGVAESAEKRGITLLGSALPTFALAARIAALLPARP